MVLVTDQRFAAETVAKCSQMTDQSRMSETRGGLGLRFLTGGVLPDLRVNPSEASRVNRARADLVEAFEPRALRALALWPVRTRTEVIAELSCHVVEPENGDIERIIIHFFGGGYISGKPEYDLPITGALATLCKARVIAPRYALAPEFPYPHAFNQAMCLYTSMISQSPSKPVALSGESAGGGLASAMALAVCHANLKPPLCLTLFSPWVDLSKEGIEATRSGKDPTLTTEQLIWFSETYLAGADTRDANVSPSLAKIPNNWPPTMLTTANGDLLRPNVLAFGDRLRQQDATVEVIEAHAPCHVFEVYDECEAAHPTLKQAADFIIANTSIHGR